MAVIINHPEYGAGIQVLNDTDLVGDAGDMINDNFYEIGNQLATGIGILSGECIWTEVQNFESGITTSGNIQYRDTFWNDLKVPVNAVKVGPAQAPDFSAFIGSTMLYWFDDNTQEQVYFVVQLPHEWKQGTNIIPHTHWVPAANGNSGDVVNWALEYYWANVGSGFDNNAVSGIIYNNTTSIGSNPLQQNEHVLTNLGTITGTNQTLSSMLACRLYRDAGGALDTDDYANDAGLLEIDFHYEIDSPGSQEEFVK